MFCAPGLIEGLLTDEEPRNETAVPVAVTKCQSMPPTSTGTDIAGGSGSELSRDCSDRLVAGRLIEDLPRDLFPELADVVGHAYLPRLQRGAAKFNCSRRQAAVRTCASSWPEIHSSVVVLTGRPGPAFASAPNMRHSASMAASNSFTGAGRDSGSWRCWSMKKSYATSEGTWARTKPSPHRRRSHWFATTRLRASAASQLNTC
jgi:hypothetical protein